MTDKEKRAIEEECNIMMDNWQLNKIKAKAKKTLINFIEKQQKEIENYKMEHETLSEANDTILRMEQQYYNLKEQLEKKDKQIDIMANRLLYNEKGWHNKEEIKQYFEKEAEND